MMEKTVESRKNEAAVGELRMAELLGRGEVRTDLRGVRAKVARRRVLVTGAGGSIGSEIVRQLAALRPGLLVLLDLDEPRLLDLASEVNGAVPTEIVLADVGKRHGMLTAFMAHRPEIVFHAAGHKYVDVLEADPEAALATNILGTANVAKAASLSGSERFVLTSSHKAVRPESVMGASKWFAEQVLWSQHRNGCSYSAVRFGNVLGSRGSVLPTFQRQIARGGPVTVTDPGMARYFMSMREAVHLTLQAAALSEGGDVFTLDMGEPVNILELARRTIVQSGGVPGRDVDVVIVGARNGEALVEDVIAPEERPLPTRHPGVLVSRPVALESDVVRSAIRSLQAIAATGRSDELAARMKTIPATMRDPAVAGTGAVGAR
jgi:FlaA1/EpsC-like NDP-sugar epimerase